MQNGSSSSALFLFCGNFGILLINSSWINVDGGKAALARLLLFGGINDTITRRHKRHKRFPLPDSEGSDVGIYTTSSKTCVGKTGRQDSNI